MNILEFSIKVKDMASGKIDETTKKTKDLKKEADKTTSAFSGLGKVIGALAIGAVLKDSLDKWDKQAQAVGGLNLAIKNTRGEVEGLSETLQKSASKLQDKSIFGDEDVIRAQTAIMKYGNVYGDNFSRLQQVSADFVSAQKGTAASGEDLVSTAEMLGRVLENPTEGMMMLRRQGVILTDTQKEQIKTFQEAGNIQAAQGIILGELEGKYAGFAEEVSKTGKGPMIQFMGVVADVQEKLGEALAPALIQITDFFKGLAKDVDGNYVAFNSLKETLSGVAETLITVAKWIKENWSWISKLLKVVLLVVAAYKTYHFVVGLITAATKAWAVVQGILNVVMSANPIGVVIAAIGLLVGAVVLAYNEFDWFKDMVDGVWASIKKLGDNLINFVKTTLSPFVEAFALIQEGKYMDAAKKIGKGLLGANPLGMASRVLSGELTDGVVDAYKKAGDLNRKQRQKDKAEGQADEVVVEVPPGGGTSDIIPKGDKTGADKSSISGVGGGRGGVTIQIDKLVEKLEIKTGGGLNDKDVEDTIVRVLLSSLNEVSRTYN